MLSSSSTQTIALPPDTLRGSHSRQQGYNLPHSGGTLNIGYYPYSENDASGKMNAFCQTVLNIQPNKLPSSNYLYYRPGYNRRKYKKLVDSSTNTPKPKAAAPSASIPVVYSHQLWTRPLPIIHSNDQHTMKHCYSDPSPSSTHCRSSSATPLPYYHFPVPSGIAAPAQMPLSRFGVFPRCSVPAPRQLPWDWEAQLLREIEALDKLLTPSDKDCELRIRCCRKVERIVREGFGTESVTAHLFGSSVNGLCTPLSDVDILLDSRNAGDPHGPRDLANMYALAQVLRANGMVNVLPVSEARVPICKFDDPEFDLKCDINVNNSAALRNTELIQKYVQLDPRVRQLLLLVKHWAKERLLNDAKGGTLSSYCWSMIVLYFLQTREPPVIPSLHSLYYDKVAECKTAEEIKQIPSQVTINGLDCSFYDDLSTLPFKTLNKDSIASLFYQFFYFLALDFDFDTQVMSVRSGSAISKISKDWTCIVKGQFNFLCVEEPFVISRNLANNVDAISVEGLKREFGRALAILSKQMAVFEPNASGGEYHRDGMPAGSLLRQVCQRWQPPAHYCFDQPLSAPIPVASSGVPLQYMPNMYYDGAEYLNQPSGSNFFDESFLSKQQRDCGKVGKVIELASSVNSLRPAKGNRGASGRSKAATACKGTSAKAPVSKPKDAAESPEKLAAEPDAGRADLKKDKRQENAIKWKSFRDNEKTTGKGSASGGSCSDSSEPNSESNSDTQFLEEDLAQMALSNTSAAKGSKRRESLNFGRDYASYLTNYVPIQRDSAATNYSPGYEKLTPEVVENRRSFIRDNVLSELEPVVIDLSSSKSKSDSAVDLPGDIGECRLAKPNKHSRSQSNSQAESVSAASRQKTWADVIRVQK